MAQFGSVYKCLCFDFHSYFFSKMTMLENFLSESLGRHIIFSSAFNIAVARKFSIENIKSEAGLTFGSKHTKIHSH